MADHFKVVCTLRDVEQRAAETLAQDIMDDHGEDLDAARGDFTVEVFEVRGSMTLNTGWVPAELA